MTRPLLSILICSVESRTEKRKDLIDGLKKQIGEYHTDVGSAPHYLLEKFIGKYAEIIVCTDNKQMTVGAKRNLLLLNATGEYVAFIDDDDRVAYNYADLLLDKITVNPDVIVFNVARYVNGKEELMVSYGIEHKKDSNTRHRYLRIPNHLMCVKRIIASQVAFKDVSFGEDGDYAARLLPLLKYQERIDKTLYAYYFDNRTTETAKR